jgi:hypothetical protein
VEGVSREVRVCAVDLKDQGRFRPVRIRFAAVDLDLSAWPTA